MPLFMRNQNCELQSVFRHANCLTPIFISRRQDPYCLSPGRAIRIDYRSCYPLSSYMGDRHVFIGYSPAKRKIFHCGLTSLSSYFVFGQLYPQSVYLLGRSWMCLTFACIKGEVTPSKLLPPLVSSFTNSRITLYRSVSITSIIRNPYPIYSFTKLTDSG